MYIKIISAKTITNKVEKLFKKKLKLSIFSLPYNFVFNKPGNPNNDFFNIFFGEAQPASNQKQLLNYYNTLYIKNTTHTYSV